MPRGRPPGAPQPVADPETLRANRVDEAAARLALSVSRLRVQRGWNRQQLADAAGLNHAVVTGVETGSRDPSFSSIVKLARALDVDSWSELLGSAPLETGEGACS
jgi:transcriptional regulator with XRE-family HTH domain